VKVFISWSGTRSHAVAQALAVWTKKVIQSVDPWVSSDLERGVKWMAEIGKGLDSHSIGIVCVTPGNVRAPWLNFEAGALSKHLGDEGRVIPYLLDFHSPSDLKAPLAQFNACLADEAGTWQLVKTLNSHAEYAQTEETLLETFGVWWPKLGQELQGITDSVTSQPPSRRSVDDKVDELLELTRHIDRLQYESSLDEPIPSGLGRPLSEASAIGWLWACTDPACELMVRSGGPTNCPIHGTPMVLLGV
jgi:TIR domain